MKTVTAFGYFAKSSPVFDVLQIDRERLWRNEKFQSCLPMAGQTQFLTSCGRQGGASPVFKGKECSGQEDSVGKLTWILLNDVIVKCANGRRACLYEAINGLECLCGRFQASLPGWISGRLFTWSIMQGIICEFSSFGSKWNFILALASAEWYSVTNDTTHANLVAFSRQRTLHENYSSRQTGLERWYENFSARFAQILGSLRSHDGYGR